MMITTQIRHHREIMLFIGKPKGSSRMISNPPYHHTHLDLSTCRVCSVKHRMMMRQYLPRLWYDSYPLHAWSRSLSFFLVRWSVICSQDCCFMASPKAHCQKSISVTIFTSTAWRTLGLFGAFPTRARSGEGDVPLDRTRVMRIIQIGENKKTHSRGECIGKCTLLPIIFGLWQTSSIFGFFFMFL